MSATLKFLPLALLLTPALALPQALDPAQLQELDDDRRDIEYQGLSLDRLDDMDLVRDGEVIGEVDEVLGDADGRVLALAIEFEGAASGLGEQEVVLPIEQVNIADDGRTLEVSLSDEELAALPKWEG